MLVIRIILWLLLGVLALLLLTPIGADLGYEDGRLHVAATVWGLRLQLFPRAPREPREPGTEKPKKEKKPAQPKAEGTKSRRELPIDRDELPELLLELVKVLLRGFGRFGRKFRIDRFRLVYLAAGQDPYNVAMSYGWLNAALSTLAPLCARRFAVRELEVRTAVDFTEDWPKLDFALGFSIRLGQVLGTGISLGFGALRLLVPAVLRKRRASRRAAPALAAVAAEAESQAGQTGTAETEETCEAATDSPESIEEEHHG